MVNNGPNINPKNKKSFSDSFAQADLEIPQNAAVEELSRCYKTKAAVSRALASIGQYNFINLTHHYNEAAIALAMYAGNGIVIKVIPESFLARTEAIYHLPAIITRRVEGQSEQVRNFVIKAYPWLNGPKVTPDTVEKLRIQISKIGLEFTPKDDHPRNLRMLPDQKKTVVGIDSNMYQGNDVEDNLVTKWHEYIHQLYPIYDEALETGTIPDQNDDTNFNPMTIHNRDSGLVSFNHFLNPEADATHATKKPAQTSIWNRLSSVFSL